MSDNNLALWMIVLAWSSFIMGAPRGYRGGVMRLLTPAVVALVVSGAFVALFVGTVNARKDAKPVLFGRCYVMNDNVVTCP